MKTKIKSKKSEKNEKEQTAEEKYYVYILECADKSLYTGITNNLEKRIDIHNSGNGAKYTRGRTPVSLVYSEILESKGNALKREIEIKKLSREEKLRLISQN